MHVSISHRTELLYIASIGSLDSQMARVLDGYSCIIHKDEEKPCSSTTVGKSKTAAYLMDTERCTHDNGNQPTRAPYHFASLSNNFLN